MKPEIKQKLNTILKSYNDQVEADKQHASNVLREGNERLARFRGLQQSIIAPAMTEIERELKAAQLSVSVDHGNNPQSRKLHPNSQYSAFDFKSPAGVATLLIWQSKENPEVDFSFSMSRNSYKHFSLDPTKLDEDAVHTYVSELVEEALTRKPSVK